LTKEKTIVINHENNVNYYFHDLSQLFFSPLVVITYTFMKMLIYMS